MALAASGDDAVGCILYREVVRDAVTTEADYVITEQNCWGIVAVHESAHCFGLRDNVSSDGSIMVYGEIAAADDPEEVEGLGFGSEGLRKIVICPYPGKARWPPVPTPTPTPIP
jgi:hypothetical protein